VFDGAGAISGGGGNPRLLIDYPERQRNEILSTYAHGRAGLGTVDSVDATAVSGYETQQFDAFSVAPGTDPTPKRVGAIHGFLAGELPRHPGDLRPASTPPAAASACRSSVRGLGIIAPLSGGRCAVHPTRFCSIPAAGKSLWFAIPGPAH
jgi:hypothetical protein